MAESSSSEIHELLTAAKAGDGRALGALLEAHNGYLKVLARRQIEGRLKARLDESDLAQQSCLSALRNFAKFRGETPGEFAAWLREIHERNVQDAIRNHLVAARRAAGREESPADDGRIDDSAWSPSRRLLVGEQAVLLARAMEQLPLDQREAVRLRFLEGLPLLEIATRLGRSRDAAAGLLKRGLLQLRSRLS